MHRAVESPLLEEILTVVRNHYFEEPTDSCRLRWEEEGKGTYERSEEIIIR